MDINFKEYKIGLNKEEPVERMCIKYHSINSIKTHKYVLTIHI